MIPKSEKKINPPVGHGIAGRGNEIFIVLIMVLGVTLVVGAFRLYQMRDEKIDIQYESQAFSLGALEQGREQATSTEQFVASKNGTKYYPVGCSYSNRIKEENRIFFGSEEEAQKAGFERTVQC